MERELYGALYDLVYEAGRSRRTKHVVFCDANIVCVYLWAVLHDRPIRWACRRRHWPEKAVRMSLPSEATMSRRLRRAEVQALIRAVEEALIRRQASADPIACIDAMPLRVGSGTKDPDAAAGYAGAGKGKGYKLHLICDSQRIPLVWTVVAMNHNEAKIAPDLVRRLPAYVGTEGLLLGDTAYDVNTLYDLAAERGRLLYAPRRRGGGKGFGHYRHSPLRLLVHREKSAAWRRRLDDRRKEVERCFAHLTGGSLGLKPLPSWVRGLRRVNQWVQAKIIIYLAVRRLRAAEVGA